MRSDHAARFVELPELEGLGFRAWDLGLVSLRLMGMTSLFMVGSFEVLRDGS